MKKVFLWFRIIRPETLFASLCPVLVGILLAHSFFGRTDSCMNLAAVLTATCAIVLQILSNLINDYYDYRRGTDKAGRVGFKRALAEGTVGEREIIAACYVVFFCATMLGAALCYIGGWVIIAIGLSALLFAWLYSATRYSLSYLGIADIFVFLYYGVVAVWGTVWLQYRAAGLAGGFAHSTAVYAGGVCGLISMCALAINNIRDMDSDRLAGKRTVPVRVGKKAALCLMGCLVALVPVFSWLAFGLDWTLAVSLPTAVLYYCVLRAEGAQYNRCVLLTGIVSLVYVGLVWLSI